MSPCWLPSSTGNGAAQSGGSRCDLPVPRGTCGGELRCRLLLRRIPWASLLLVLLASLLPATPAAADGKVFGPITPSERGLQVDAAVFSPQAALWSPSLGGAKSQESASEPTPRPGQTYVVQPGDTLSKIAARFGVDQADLASRNGLEDPDYIQVGQSLALDLPPAFSSMPPLDVESRAVEEGDLLRVQAWPWPPTQGQTLAVWLEARRPVSFELSFDNVAYPVVLQGRRGWGLVPIPALTAPGDHSLAVSAGDTDVGFTVPVEAGTFELYHIPAGVSRPILSQAQKVQAESVELKKLTRGWSPSGWTPRDRFRSPLAGEYPRSSPFGSRRTYEPNPAVSAHEGEDYSVPAGTAVTAPAAGVVVLAEPLFVRGNAVVVDHGSGVYTGYWHLQELAVRRGDRVQPGQLLGRVGSTGLSTGAHLHWELRVNGIAVDPLQWLEQ
jgi:murein DD-endopeptidase MepM/ murein hydrolase activator NlpD